MSAREATTREATEAMTDAHGWRPIASAPRDGSTVLLWAMGWRSPQTGWTCDNDDWQDVRGTRYPPTHWQPLPAPPESAP